MKQLKSEPVALFGGVDSVTTPLLVQPGKLISSSNYEPDINGGYRRMSGFERYDGQPRPSDASYWIMEVDTSGTFNVGDEITGATSGATGKVVLIAEAAVVESGFGGFFDLLSLCGITVSSPSTTSLSILILAKVTGTFSASETINVGGSPQGTFVDIEENTASTGTLHAQYKNLAADAVRADIQSPPGSGPIRGVWYYKENLYCFRDNVAATECIMYKATSSGWSAITFGRELQFSTTTGEIFEGDTVDQVSSGASGVVKRVLLRTGTWGGTAAGTLVFDSITNGPFDHGQQLRVAGVNKAVTNGADTPITLQPGGRFEFDNINFFGTVDKQRMYFVDGVNYISEFDGTRLVPIRTGIGNDSPKHIVGHKNHLMVSVESSVQVSGIGNPYSWTALTGAAELGLGEECTGLLPQVGDAASGVLVITTDTRVLILYGNDTSDFNLVVYSPEAGAHRYTLQNIGFAYFMNKRGITQIQSSQAFGGFEMSVFSRLMQPFIDEKQGLQTASCVVEKKNQYRIFFNDGQGLIMHLSQTDNGMTASLMPFDYGEDLYINQVCSFTDTSGAERLLAAGSDGYVYELDRGTSFDGEPIAAHFMSVFNHSKSVRYIKRYKRTILQFRATNTVNVSIGYDLSYGNLDPAYSNAVSTPQVIAKTTNEVGGYWDNFNWDSFSWDASYLQEINVDTPGNGESIALIVSGETDLDEPYTVHTCITQYIDGRLNR